MTIPLLHKVLKSYGTEWIVEIRDVTEFVQEQHELVRVGKLEALQVAKERVYSVTDQTVALQLGLSDYKTQI